MKLEQTDVCNTIYPDDNTIETLRIVYKASSVLKKMTTDLRSELLRLQTALSSSGLPATPALNDIIATFTVNDTPIKIDECVENYNTVRTWLPAITTWLNTQLSTDTFNTYGRSPALGTQYTEITLTTPNFINATQLTQLRNGISAELDTIAQMLSLVDKFLIYNSVSGLSMSEVTYAKVTGNTTVEQDLTIPPVASLVDDFVSIESSYMDRAFKARMNIRYLSTDTNHYAIWYDFETKQWGKFGAAIGALPTLSNAEILANEDPDKQNNIQHSLQIGKGWTYRDGRYATHDLRVVTARGITTSPNRVASRVWVKSQTYNQEGTLTSTTIRRVFTYDAGNMGSYEYFQSIVAAAVFTHHNARLNFAIILYSRERYDPFPTSEREGETLIACQVTDATQRGAVQRLISEYRTDNWNYNLFCYSNSGNTIYQVMSSGRGRPNASADYTATRFNRVQITNDTLTISSSIMPTLSHTLGTQGWGAICDAENDTAFIRIRITRDSGSSTNNSYLNRRTGTAGNIAVSFSATATNHEFKIFRHQGEFKLLWRLLSDATYTVTNYNAASPTNDSGLAATTWSRYPSIACVNSDNASQVYQEEPTVTWFEGKVFKTDHTFTKRYGLFNPTFADYDMVHMTYLNSLNSEKTNFYLVNSTELPLRYRAKFNSSPTQNLYIYSDDD